MHQLRRSAAALAAVGAAIGVGLWLLSGLVFFAVTFTSSRWRPAIALVVPPTVPEGVWQQVSPWNVVLPSLGALLFGGLLGVGLYWLLSRPAWQSASTSIRTLSAWIVVVAAAFLEAAVWALGNTIANARPTGFAWAFRSAQPDLLASGYFGVVWGWLPALVIALIATRRAPSRVNPGEPTQEHASTVAGARRRHPRWSSWALALAAVLTVGLAVAVVVAQPAAARAGRIAAGGTPDGLPTATPTPTPKPGPPPRVALAPVQPGPDWCVPDQTSLSASGVQAALGHRDLTLVLINRSSRACVVDGYPDIAFADAEGHALDAAIEHGSSYTATDPGTAEIHLAPGASAEAHLSWGATGARDDAAATLWTAAYPGAPRTRLAINSGIVADSRVSVTAWAAPAAG